MLNFALKYQKLGLSVIPLKPKSKEPLILWSDFQSRVATEKEIQFWWTTWPFANVGIVTGKVSGVVVVDLDGKEGINQASILKLSSPVTSLTGNGKHLWYKHPNSPVLNAVRLYQGIDIRGDGGYVLAAPSVHPNGSRYRWIRPLLDVTTLPEFPLSLQTVGNASCDTGKEENFKPKLDIAQLLKEMQDGNIDDTLFTICSRLRADNYSADDALVFLEPHAERVGATPGHLAEKIANVWSRYEPNERKTASVVSVSQPEEGTDAETVEDFFKTEEKVSWIAPGLVAANSLGFVVGLPETSKTWMLIDLATEAARGGNWLSIFPVKKSKVWFIDQERFRGETQRRFKALLVAKNLNAKALPDMRINSGNTSFKLDLDQSYAAFRKRLEINRPDLVIIDSMATFHTKEENNRKDIQEVLERLKALRNEFNCTFLLIHHENKLSYQSKDEGKEPSLAEMSGNIAIPAAAETVITVRKRIDGSSVVYHTKSTMSKQHKPFEIKVNDLDGPSKIEVRGYL